MLISVTSKDGKTDPARRADSGRLDDSPAPFDDHRHLAGDSDRRRRQTVPGARFAGKIKAVRRHDRRRLDRARKIERQLDGRFRRRADRRNIWSEILGGFTRSTNSNKRSSLTATTRRFGSAMSPTSNSAHESNAATPAANGKPAVIMSVQKQPGASTIELTEKVDAGRSENCKRLCPPTSKSTRIFSASRILSRPRIRLAVSSSG